MHVHTSTEINPKARVYEIPNRTDMYAVALGMHFAEATIHVTLDEWNTLDQAVRKQIAALVEVNAKLAAES